MVLHLWLLHLHGLLLWLHLLSLTGGRLELLRSLRNDGPQDGLALRAARDGRVSRTNIGRKPQHASGALELHACGGGNREDGGRRLMHQRSLLHRAGRHRIGSSLHRERRALLLLLQQL